MNISKFSIKSKENFRNMENIGTDYDNQETVV
jgi:hypothetical protein